jgi:hypothetical protein
LKVTASRRLRAEKAIPKTGMSVTEMAAIAVLT